MRLVIVYTQFCPILSHLEAQLKPDRIVGEEQHVKEVLLHTNVSVGAAVRVEHKPLALHLNLKNNKAIR